MTPTRYINAGPMPALADPSAAMAPGKALENLGHAIENTGEKGLNLVARSRKIEEGGATVAFLADAHKQAAEFAGKLAQRSDTDAWADEWRQKAEALRQQGKNLKLSPEAKARLESELLDFTTRQGISFEVQARTKGLGIARSQNEQTLAYHRARNEKVPHDRALKIAGDSGLMDPAEIQRAELLYKQQESIQSLQDQFKADPQAVIDTSDEEYLKQLPGGTLEMFENARNAARSQKQKFRAEELDLLEADLDKGVLHPRSIEAAKWITPGDVAKLSKAMKKVDPPTSEAHGKVWNLLLANRETFTDRAVSDHDYAERWNTLRSEVIGMVPPEFAGDIRQELSYRSPANRTEAKTKPRPSNDRQELKSVSLERITRAREANLFGSVDKDADPVTREKAFRRAEELRLQTSRFINDTPDLTLDKVTEFTDGLISGDRVKTSASELQNFVPGAAQRLRPAPAMPSLPMKSGAKDKAIADPLQIPPGTGQASGALLPPPLQQLDTFLDQ